MCPGTHSWASACPFWARSRPNAPPTHPPPCAAGPGDRPPDGPHPGAPAQQRVGPLGIRAGELGCPGGDLGWQPPAACLLQFHPRREPLCRPRLLRCSRDPSLQQLPPPLACAPAHHPAARLSAPLVTADLLTSTSPASPPAADGQQHQRVDGTCVHWRLQGGAGRRQGGQAAGQAGSGAGRHTGGSRGPSARRSVGRLAGGQAAQQQPGVRATGNGRCGGRRCVWVGSQLGGKAWVLHGAEYELRDTEGWSDLGGGQCRPPRAGRGKLLHVAEWLVGCLCGPRRQQTAPLPPCPTQQTTRRRERRPRCL